MEREYVNRGRRVAVVEVTDVAAVKPATDRQSEDDIERLGGRADVDAVTPLGREQRELEQAGWVFVVPTEDVRGAVNTRRAPPGVDSVQRVFVEPSGRVLLGLDRLSVRLSSDLSEDQAREMLAAAGVEIVHQLTFAPNLFQVRVPADRDFLQVSIELSEHPDVEYAEPSFIEQIPARFAPADPLYGEQWHLNNTGQYQGLVGADLRTEHAWETSRGRGVRIAIVDHGFQVSHEDLEQAVDDQVSGHFREPRDPQDRAEFVRGLLRMPKSGHGTFCAGIAVARAGNNAGGCGIAHQAEFIAVATLSDTFGTQETLARAIAYAANPANEKVARKGADVISCSLGPSGQPWTMTRVLQDAIDHAVTSGRGGRGTPIFWAVDNARVPIAQDAVCSYDKVIAVGSSTRHDLPGNCAFGPELDFVATGVEVFSTRSRNRYGVDSGTSYAAPAAAAVAALLIAKRRTLTWQNVRQIMRAQCDKIGGGAVVYSADGHSTDCGFGRVNAANALAALPPP